MREKVLHTSPVRGKMLTVKDGFLLCPVCRAKRLMRISPNTTATEVVVFCRFCKAEHIVDIEQGQCFESRSR